MTLRFFPLLKQLTQSPTAIIKESNLSGKIAVLVNLVNHHTGFSDYALWLTVLQVFTRALCQATELQASSLWNEAMDDGKTVVSPLYFHL